jgi:hypothetical protein
MIDKEEPVAGSAASSCWAADLDHCPIDVPVLVTDGEEVGIDKLILHYEINGRVLLPSDKRRYDMTPEIRWSRFVNVTHWMPLPLPPNPRVDRAGEAGSASNELLATRKPGDEK